MKTYLALLLSVFLLGTLAAETFRLDVRQPSDIQIAEQSRKFFQVETAAVFDRTLNRDVLRIRYALKPGIKKAQALVITFPALQKVQWQSGAAVRVMLRGGIGHLRYDITDVNGETFVQKGFPQPEAEWKDFVFDYRNISPASHHIFGGKDKSRRNRKADPPLRLGSFSCLVRPGHVAAQLRKTGFRHSLKATDAELAKGMQPVDMYLAAVSVTTSAPGAPAEKSVTAPKFVFQEIGTEFPLKAGNREKLNFTVSNPSDKEMKCSIRVSSQRVLTEVLEKYQEELTLPAGGTKKITLPFHFSENGYYDVRLTAACGGRDFSEKTFVNVWTPAGNKGETVHPYFFGTQGALDLFYRDFPPARREQDYRNMRDAGVVVMRTPLRWKSVQPKKGGAYNWKAYDHIVKKCLEYGITPYFIVATAPAWADADPAVRKSAPGFVYSCHPDNKLYAEFFAKVVERYGDKVIPQVWNEPYANQYYWGGTPATYADMVKQAFPAAKKVNPKVIVNTGACWDEVFPMTLGSFDHWPFHHHGVADTFPAAISRHRAMLARAGKTDMSLFWADECGLSVDNLIDNSELLKASEVIKKSILSRANGLSMHVCFVWRGSPRAPTSRRDNYPFMDEKHRCRPVVTAHNTMVRNMRNTVPEKDFSRPGDGYACLFRRPGGKLLVFWRTSIAKGQIMTVRFQKPVKGSLVNLYGSPLPFSATGTGYSVMLTPEPCYLSLPADTEIKEISFASLVRIPAQSILKLGELRNTVPVEVFNPFPIVLKGTVTARAGGGWSAENGTQTVSIAPGGKANLSFTFRNAKPSSGICYADLLFRAPEKKISFGSSVRFMNCLPLSGEEKLLASLDTADSIVSLRPGDVDADMFWQGKDDLSVRIFGCYDRNVLKLRFEVTDNKHYQVQPAKGLFVGDSIQLAFRSPEYSQFGIALLNDGQKTFNQWKGKYPLPVDYSIVRRGNVTEYKVAIPWKNLSLAPEKGTSFEMCALFNDNDGRCRKILLEWGGGIHGMGAVNPMNPIILE